MNTWFKAMFTPFTDFICFRISITETGISLFLRYFLLKVCLSVCLSWLSVCLFSFLSYLFKTEAYFLLNISLFADIKCKWCFDGLALWYYGLTVTVPECILALPPFDFIYFLYLFVERHK